MDMKVVEFENPLGKRIPAWLRTVYVREDGEVFVPAAIAGADSDVGLCAIYSQTHAVKVGTHLYVPARWMETVFPEAADKARLMSVRALEISKSG